MNALRAVIDGIGRQWRWLKWLVAASVVGVIVYRYRATFAGFRWNEVHWLALLGALALAAGAMLLTFVRWYILVWAQEFPFRLSDAFRLGFIGYLFNFVAPGVVGGDLVKGALIAKEQTSRRVVAVATVLLDRAVGLLALLMIGAVAVLAPTPVTGHAAFKGARWLFWFGTAAGLIGSAAALLPAVPRSRIMQRLVRLPVVGRFIGEMVGALLLYQSRWRVLVLTLGLSVISHLGLLTAFYVGALAVNPPSEVPGYLTHLQIIPIAELAGVVVPLPGGAGALEGAVEYFYLLSGSADGHGILTALAYRVVTIVIALVGAGYYFASRREIEQAVEAVSHSNGDAEGHSRRQLPVE